jgi:hypothetical protein
LEDWFIFNLSPTGASDAFVREWRKMIEFAFSLPKWESNHRSEDMWLHLMGVFSFLGHGDRYWTRENRAAIRQTKDLYEKWAKVHLKSQYSASQFINFLAYPAAEPLLLDALIWLREAACEASDRYWDDKGMRENLARLLNHCWRFYQPTLRQNKLAFGAFKALLKVLVDHQDSIALVLQDHISRES